MVTVQKTSPTYANLKRLGGNNKIFTETGNTKPGLHSDLIIKLRQSMNSFIYWVFFRSPTNKVEKVQRKQNRNSGIEITIYNQFWTLVSSFHRALEEFSCNSKHCTLLVRDKCLWLWSTRLKLIVEVNKYLIFESAGGSRPAIRRIFPTGCHRGPLSHAEGLHQSLRT